jgi:hypothetical protein
MKIFHQPADTIELRKLILFLNDKLKASKMTTPAQLLDHYNSNLRPSLARPMDFAAWYKNLPALGTGANPVNVNVHKYRMNTEDPSNLDEAGRIRDLVADNEIQRARSSVNAWVRGLPRNDAALARLRNLRLIGSHGQGPRRFRRVFTGKGSPRDISLVLGLLDVSGRLARLFPGFDSQTAMQSYCDRFIGVDCSGFVNNYFTALGRRSSDDLTDRPGIPVYAGVSRRLTALPGSPRNHVFCWVKGESHTGVAPRAKIRFAHIIAIDDWVMPPSADDPAGARFRCTQSSSSLGGITNQVYEIIAGLPLGDERPRRPPNCWRIQRIRGLGDNVLEPANIIWNDVFLAPPF